MTEDGTGMTSSVVRRSSSVKPHFVLAVGILAVSSSAFLITFARQDGMPAVAIAALRAAETIGRPLGGPAFLERVAASTGRKPRPAKRGRKPRGETPGGATRIYARATAIRNPVASLRGAKRRSNPGFASTWIASFRSQ